MGLKKPLVNTSGEITEISTSDQIPYQNLASGTPTTGQAPVYNGTDVSWSDVASSGGLTVTEKTDHYTLLTADAGGLFIMNSSSNKDFTVNGSLNLDVGDQIHLLRTGTGEVSIVASGATINNPGGLRLRARYSTATLLCTATDVYVLIGDTKV